MIQILATLRKMHCVRWLQLKQDPFLNLETRGIITNSEIHSAVQKGRLNYVTWLKHFTDSGLSLVNTFLLWLYDPVHHWLFDRSDMEMGLFKIFGACPHRTRYRFSFVVCRCYHKSYCHVGTVFHVPLTSLRAGRSEEHWNSLNPSVWINAVTAMWGP